MGARIETLIIHLSRATERRDQVSRLVEQSPYRAHILDACDGSALEVSVKNRLYSGRKLYDPAYPFRLSDGEIGCFESHRRAWQRIISEKLDAALILEDDVALNGPVFDAAIAMAEAHLPRFPYLKLPIRVPRAPMTTLAESGTVSITETQTAPLGMVAQLVSHRAAERLLELTGQFDRPVDTFLQMVWLTGIPLRCVLPSGVCEVSAELGGTTVQHKRSPAQSLVAEWKRFHYRRAITRLSRTEPPR